MGEFHVVGAGETQRVCQGVIVQNGFGDVVVSHFLAGKEQRFEDGKDTTVEEQNDHPLSDGGLGFT